MPTLNMSKLGDALGGWEHKDDTAAEYKWSDSNYRTYKPATSPTPDGGLFLSTKLDHIRGWGGDDHCQLEITLDSACNVVSSRAMLTMGDHSFNTDIIEAATQGSSLEQQAGIIAEVYDLLCDQIAAWGEHGGRANFPAVTQHNFNLIVDAVS